MNAAAFDPINPAEWTAIGHYAVKTRSLMTAVRIARQIKTLGGHGEIDGVPWMGLGLFHHKLEQQS